MGASILPNAYIIGNPKIRAIASLHELGKFNTTFELVNPNFYSNYPNKFRPDVSLVKMRRKLVLGELGCAQSHLDAYTRFLRTNEPLALIIEDDVHLDASALNNISNSMNIISFLNQNNSASEFVWSFETGSALLSSKVFVEGFYYVFGEPSHTTCYIINRKAAESLLKSNLNLDYTADWPKTTSVIYFLSTQNLVEHGSKLKPTTSLISKERDSEVPSLSQKVKAFGKIIFVDYFRQESEFESYTNFCRLLIWPIIRWKILLLGAKHLPGWSSNVKTVAGLNIVASNLYKFKFKNFLK